MSEIREISITKINGDDYWDIWVSDGIEINKLERKGWTIERGENRGEYVRCRIPAKALTIRTKTAVESLARRSEEMKGMSFPDPKYKSPRDNGIV